MPKELHCLITFTTPSQYMVSPTQPMTSPRIGVVVITTKAYRLICYITNRKNNEDVIEEAIILDRDREQIADYLMHGADDAEK